MSKKPKFNRRTMLSLTAAGLVGSSTAIAASDDVVLTEYDADSSVNWDTDAWPQVGYDNGRTSYNAAASGPTGELSVSWKFGEESFSGQIPIVADGTVYTIQGAPLYGVQKLYALSSDDGTERWVAELKGDYEQNAKDDDAPRYTYDMRSTAVADGTVYTSRLDRTEVFDAENGDRLWTVETGGNNIAVTDELLVVDSPLLSDGNHEVGHRVVALSREDGSVEWTYNFRGRGPTTLDPTLDIVVADGSVYALYDAVDPEEKKVLRSISLDSGEEEWSREATSLEGDMVATASELYVSLGNALLVLDPKTGDEKWTNDSEYAVKAVGDGTAYCTDGNVVTAFDAASGAEQWRVETNRRGSARIVHDELVVAGDVLYYTITKDDTVNDKPAVRDVETGELLGRYELPETADRDDGLLDATNYLAPAGEKLYTVSDDALVAFCDKSDDESDGVDSDDGDDSGGGEGGDGSDEDEFDDCYRTTSQLPNSLREYKAHTQTKR
ncbi:PQQ-binding-like beta-propeller repeat protein [Haladaptatus pallidirubidus]